MIFTAMGLDEIIKEMSAAREERSGHSNIKKLRTDTRNQQRNSGRSNQEVKGEALESGGT